jgi:hypothetical protein
MRWELSPRRKRRGCAKPKGMNLLRIYLIAILLLGFGGAADGQEAPTAVLVDAFAVVPCDEFLGRLDVYFAELRNVPASKGVVIVRNDPSKRHRSVMVQELIEAHFRGRDWKQEPLDYVRADKDGGQLIQLWRLPPGSTGPEVDRRIESFPVHESVRQPFMMGYETKFGAQICPEIDDQRIFADFLKANPSARGNIVVRDNSRKKARRAAARILRKFKVTYGISRDRLRAFHTTLQRPSNHDEPIVEYWYLP